MVYVALEESYPKAKPQSDGWSPAWRHWFAARGQAVSEPDHAPAIIHTVRVALSSLGRTERTVIEMYFYDGFSWKRIGDHLGLPAAGIRVIHRRALTVLERHLAPFVRESFGLELASHPECPICVAPWRRVAEEILDSKTADMTWGQIGCRLERAVGWRPPTPQISIAHQRHHRSFTPAVAAEECFDALFTELPEEP
ncbi:MAG TPA: sigma-70 family RNA polymerase sigma factor [Acidobacteriota bacterium]|nr:sigma-70 family RNA polymerase sigma factor [Acidobacteriota bacterium]